MSKRTSGLMIGALMFLGCAARQSIGPIDPICADQCEQIFYACEAAGPKDLGGAIAQDIVDCNPAKGRCLQRCAAAAQAVVAERQYQQAHGSEESADTMAGDDATQLDRDLKWIQHLKDVGAISDEEYEQDRLKAFKEHPGAKP